MRGLYWEDIQAKVLALEEAHCTTLEKLLQLVEADGLGKRSVRDTKNCGEVSSYQLGEER